MHARYAELNPGGMTFTGIMPVMWVISAFVVWGFFQLGGAPHAVTRFLIPETDKTLKRALVYSILFQSFIFICFALLAISGHVLLPTLERADLTVPTMVSQFLPPIIGGVIIAAALGAMMSTVDSILLITGSLVVENIYRKAKKGEVDNKKALRLGRIMTLVLGILGLAVAIRPPAAILWIVTMSFQLLASAFLFPLLLGLWWPRATKAGGLAGMIGGVLSCVVWYALGYIQYQSFNNWIGGIWPAILGSVISLILVVVVSLASKPSPQDVIDTFFDDILVKS
jgi:Na+/proline symporter